MVGHLHLLIESVTKKCDRKTPDTNKSNPQVPTMLCRVTQKPTSIWAISLFATIFSKVFLDFYIPVLHTTVLPSNWLLFHIAHLTKYGFWNNCKREIFHYRFILMFPDLFQFILSSNMQHQIGWNLEYIQSPTSTFTLNSIYGTPM